MKSRNMARYRIMNITTGESVEFYFFFLFAYGRSQTLGIITPTMPSALNTLDAVSHCYATLSDLSLLSISLPNPSTTLLAHSSVFASALLSPIVSSRPNSHASFRDRVNDRMSSAARTYLLD